MIMISISKELKSIQYEYNLMRGLLHTMYQMMQQQQDMKLKTYKKHIEGVLKLREAIRKARGL